MLMLGVYGFLMPGIDNYAHAGGFGGGYLAAMVLDPLKPERGDHILIALVCLALSIASIAAVVVHGLRFCLTCLSNRPGASTTSTRWTPRGCTARSHASSRTRRAARIFEKLANGRRRTRRAVARAVPRTWRRGAASLAVASQSRLLAAVARVFGSVAVLPLIVAEESREVGSYLRLARGATDKTTHDTAVAIATESAEHAQHLSAVDRTRGRAVARAGRRRLSPQRRLRLQRRPDGEFRPRRRRHRRQCRAAPRHRDRRLPARSPTRCRWGRAAISRRRARPRWPRGRSPSNATSCG